MRTLIKAVSRIVTAQAGSCCRCRFPLEDEYGKYEGYESHDNWELWHQDHDNINFEYFLKCTGCGYELAKQYWKDSDGTFVDYTDGIAEDSQKSVLPYKSGQRISIWVNQGERDAWVLGTLEDQIIVEYEMPSGTTALNILQNAVDVKFVKSVSYKSCPKKWIQAIRDGVGSWEGICQRNGQIDFPEQDEETQADGFWKEPTVDSRKFPSYVQADDDDKTTCENCDQEVDKGDTKLFNGHEFCNRCFEDFTPNREELEEQHGQVWNTKELQKDFTVLGFASPCVVVIRKSDGTKGTLEFIHQPRFYFDFVAG